MENEQKIETSQTKVEAPGRSWGDAVSDVAGNMLSSLANGGKLLNVVAAGLEAGINTESFQQRKQARANAARLAEVQLQQAEANLEKTRFNNEQAKKLAPLEERLTMAKISNAEQTGKNILQTNEFNEQANPHRLRNLAAQAKNSELVLRKNQELVWKNNFDAKKKQINEDLKKNFGIGNLNFVAQTAFENSPARDAFEDITVIMGALKNDPEAAKYYAEDTGWKLSNDANGTPVLTSPDGKKSFTADDAGLKKIFGEIQKQLKDDITACNIIGKDAQSIGEATAKVILKNPAVQQIYGTPGAAYSAYRDFLNRSGVDPKSGKARQVFSPEQKTWHSAHLLFRTAMEDNVFSPEEMQTLIPQAAQMIKVLGGTLKLGDSIDTTEVIWGADGGLNHTYKLKDFVNSVLAEKDVVSPLFRETMRINLNQQMKNRQGGSADGEDEMSDSAWSSLSNAYGAKFDELSDDKQKAFMSIINNSEAREQAMLRARKAKTIKDLPLDDLRRLDDGWKIDVDKKELDENAFFSPYQNEIFQRERDDLYAQKAPLIAELRELENKTSDYQEHIHGRRGQTKEQRKIISLRNKIDDINDAIKKREKHLSARGIAFKEYK